MLSNITVLSPTPIQLGSITIKLTSIGDNTFVDMTFSGEWKHEDLLQVINHVDYYLTSVTNTSVILLFDFTNTRHIPGTIFSFRSKFSKMKLQMIRSTIVCVENLLIRTFMNITMQALSPLIVTTREEAISTIQDQNE